MHKGAIDSPMKSTVTKCFSKSKNVFFLSRCCKKYLVCFHCNLIEGSIVKFFILQYSGKVDSMSKVLSEHHINVCSQLHIQQYHLKISPIVKINNM